MYNEYPTPQPPAGTAPQSPLGDTPTLKSIPLAEGATSPLAATGGAVSTAQHPYEDTETVKRPRITVGVATSAPPTRRPQWRGLSTVVAVMLFAFANVAVLFDQRPLAVAGDTLYGLQRVNACESLGTVPDIIYLGSSRTVFSGDANFVDQWVQQHEGKTILGCNVGTFSSTITQDYYTLKRMIEDGYTPKAVVEALWEYNINVNAVGGDPAHGMSAADISPLNTRQIMNLADLTDLPDIRSQLTHVDNTTLPKFIAERVLPLYGARLGLLKTVCGASNFGPCDTASSLLDTETVKRYTQVDDLGWLGITDSSIATLSQQRYTNHYQVYSNIAMGIANFQIGGHQPEYLARMADLAREHHIQLILTTPPVHPFLFEYLTHASDWQMIIDYWQQFALTHGVAYYDQSRALGYSDADFVDPQHLDAAGATKYATWLAENVIGPLAAQGW